MLTNSKDIDLIKNILSHDDLTNISEFPAAYHAALRQADIASKRLQDTHSSSQGQLFEQYEQINTFVSSIQKDYLIITGMRIAAMLFRAISDPAGSIDSMYGTCDVLNV